MLLIFDAEYALAGEIHSPLIVKYHTFLARPAPATPLKQNKITNMRLSQRD